MLNKKHDNSDLSQKGENYNINYQAKIFWYEEERKCLGKELAETKGNEGRIKQDLERKIVSF